MFQSPEEIRSIKQIPIFVWENVLLPFDTPLKTIHIIEPKYVQMLEDIALGDRYFGVTFKWMVNREINLPHVNSTGCIAELLECNSFASGDANIKIKGLARYRIVKYLETDKPYPIAEIKFFEEENEKYAEQLLANQDDELLEEELRKTCLTAQKVMTKIFRALGNNEYEFPLMNPPDPIPFSFLVGPLFSFDNGDLLHLLNCSSPIYRLQFATEWLENYEVAVDDNIERKKFLKPFQKIKNDPRLG